MSILRLDGDRLAKQIAGEFVAVGTAPDAIPHVVGSMMQTSLRGVDSHGVNLFPHYHRAVQAGRINPSPKIVIRQRAPSVVTVDADHAFGHHAGSVAMAAAIGCAGDTGVGMASVANSTHFGAASFFGLQAAAGNYAGLAFTNADALVKAHGATIPIFGTNPICFCAPMEREDAFCLDMATSATSWNKVLTYRRTQTQMPADWAHDADGQPTRDPALARMLEPSGGYKGFGLGMMVELLCGLLADGPISRELKPMFSTPLSERRHISHFFVAIRIEAFVGPDRFKSRLQSLVDGIRNLSTETQPVMVPGDPEKKMREERLRKGIPMDSEKFDEFVAISREFESCRLG